MNGAGKSVEARKLKGFRDYLPRPARLRHKIVEEVRKTAALSGFEVIDTPALEYCEVLLGSGGGDTDKEVYRFTDHGDREVALRFDLTVPFARFVTENYNELTFPFKKLQIGEVWRGEKPQKGRYRQFCQADLDIIGVDSVEADVEVIACLYRVIDAMLPTGTSFKIALNSRNILSAVIGSFFPGTTPEQEQQVLIAIDKLQKIGKDAVADMMEKTTANRNNAIALLDCLAGGNASVEAKLKGDANALAALERFQKTLSLLQELTSGGKGKIVPMLNVARGLGYYTGVVFETTIDQLPDFGSVSSGGRYNNLVARFGKHDLSGVGGSVGVDRLLAALEELKVEEDSNQTKVFIAIASDDVSSYAFKLLSTLRAKKIPADIALKTGKLGNQFKYADKKGIPYVVVLGSDEMNANTYSCKNMKSGVEEKSLSLEKLLGILS